LLGKPLRKAIIKQKMKYSLEDSDNPSQDVRRAKDKSDLIFRDLSLMTSRLPNDIQEKIFTLNRIESFISQVLNGNEKGLHSYADKKCIFKGNKKYDEKFNKRTVIIAASLVKELAEICIAYYRENHRYEPELHKYVVNPIREAAAMCTEIATKRVSLIAPPENIKLSDEAVCHTQKDEKKVK
jgi:hypothetical protein